MADIKDFYLNTPMKRYKYMRLKITDIPEEVIEQYNLRNIVTKDAYVYCKIRKGMYGLPQAGIIAQELLQERLARNTTKAKSSLDFGCMQPGTYVSH